MQNRLDGTAEALRKIVDYETTTSSLSEDKELNQAMDAQKAINRYLNFITSSLPKLKESFINFINLLLQTSFRRVPNRERKMERRERKNVQSAC